MASTKATSRYTVTQTMSSKTTVTRVSPMASKVIMSPVASKGTETSGSTEASTMTQASVMILLGLGLGHCEGGDEYGEDTHPDTHTAAGRLARGQHVAQWRLLRS